jgi:beta-aspartyl-peptidase (threonine type)
MRTRTLFLAAAIAGCRTGGGTMVSGNNTGPATLASQITSQLDRAAGDWNRGDLEAFLSDYAPESTTTFVDGRRARRGFEFIRQNYAPRFAPGARRDSLHFEEVDVRSLGSDHALVTARFVLTRGGTISASGPFTLVMQRKPAGWRILHDHSSSDPR